MGLGTMKHLASAAAALLFCAGCSNAAGAGPSTLDVGGENGAGPGGAPDGEDGGPPVSASAPAGASEPLPRVLFFNLRSAPFPGTGHPDVAVHVPIGFYGSGHPGLVVFFHGFDNCIANVVGSVDTECTPGGGARAAMHLVDQLDAARVDAILVAVELDYDQSTGNPGKLASSGDFHALLHELMTEHLDPLLGRPLDVADFDPVVIGTHSGGYEAAASVLSSGGVAAIREVDLYDSLYGETTIFDDWVKTNAARFSPSAPNALRFMDVYTSTGGTDANSQAMATSAATWLGAGAKTEILDDRTTDTLGPAGYAHPVLFKLSSLAHDDVPRFYFGELARTGVLAPLP